MTPIEQLMATALVQTEHARWKFIAGVKPDYVDCLEAARLAIDDECWSLIFPQVSIGPYVLDFLIVLKDSNCAIRGVAIECDGHEFHEKTKRQAAHDKKRDRYLAFHSITVLRFTGAEIWYDAPACAVEVRQTVGSISCGPRTTAWLGYLSDEEQDRLMELAYEAEMTREMDKMRKEERERERASERRREALKESEGYYP